MLGGNLSSRFWHTFCISFKDLLKKAHEEHTIGEDGSGIQYPRLPPSDEDEGSTGEGPTKPSPDFDGRGTSDVPPKLLRR